MDGPKALKAQLQELEKKAFAKYNAKQFSQAQVLLQQILKLSPQHTLAKFYLEKIEKQVKSKKATATPASIETTQRVIREHTQKTPPQVPSTRHPFDNSRNYIPSTKRMSRDEIIEAANVTKRISRETLVRKNVDTSGVISPPILPKTPSTRKATIESAPVKVMIVDDSSLMRKVIKRIVKKSPNLQVVGEAASGEEALKLIPKNKPNVLTLDINMPGMDGVTLLKHIIINYKLPAIMLSAYTDEGAITSFDCLTYGAVDFICKPSREGGSLSGQEQTIIDKIIKASKVRIQPLRKARLQKQKRPTDIANKASAKRVIVMGAGEGGYSGFLKTLPHLPEQLPCAILGVQYMESKYFEAFCSYLNQNSRILVKKAQDQEPIREGVCYFINQKEYLKIQASTDGYRCQVAKKPEFLMQQNVFNHLLFSAAENYGAHAIGVVLSGKGIDGIEGIRELKRVRGITLAQDPRFCITPQLSEIAINSGCIDHKVADADFPGFLWHLLKAKQKK